MTKINEIYRCNVCDNIVEVVNASVGELVCCNQPMELLTERKTNIGPEKHVPIVEKTDDGITIKVGEVIHPMEENHKIVLIEAITPNKIYRKILKEGDEPIAKFNMDSSEINDVKIREYCNVHGLWPEK